MKTLPTAVTCLALHLLTLTLLTIRRSKQAPHSTPEQSTWQPIPTLVIKATTALAAILTLIYPYLVDAGPLAQCGLRVVCFFYACKILDLGIARARNPPTRLLPNGEPAELETILDLASYISLLLTEMRYLGFDIAEKQPSHISRNIRRPFVFVLILAALDYVLIQLPELKCVCLLLFLQVVFESLHLLLHPRCPRPLFFRPFSAATMSGFWSVHWHTAAAPFIRSLAYRPGRECVGQWLGVLAAFNLTGIWHGWASAPLVDDDYAFSLGLQVWALFMMMGMICLLERWIWGEKQGGMSQRVMVWTMSIGAAGQCFRSLQLHAKIPVLRKVTR